MRVKSGIYEIVNTVNGKRYIGSAKNFASRWSLHRVHLKRGTHHSKHLQSAWDKHGESSFRFAKLLVCGSENAVMYEQLAFDALAPEYNVCKKAGSCLGMKHSEEARKKISIAKIGNQATRGMKHSAETIEKMRAVKRGNTYTKGKKRDPEAVAKTVAAHLGAKRSEETRAKIAAKAKGRRWTDEAKAKLSATLTGRKMSEEFRAKLIGNQHAAGHKHTDEWKRQNSIRNTGVSRPKSEEYRAKISAALKGVLHSPERRANQAAAQKGQKRGPYKISPERRAEMSERAKAMRAAGLFDRRK